MNKILQKIDELSFSQIASIGLTLGLLAVLPVGVNLVQRETKLLSRAAQEVPVNPTPVVYGPVPALPPEIFSVSPFLGKIGDSLIIRGKNFGNNPREKAVFFGQKELLAKEIVRWEDQEIEVLVPGGADSGFLQIRVGGREIGWSRPITVYSVTTKTQAKKQGNSVLVANGQNLAEVKLWLAGRSEVLSRKFDPPLAVGSIPQVFLEDLPQKKIESLALYDPTGNFVPFFVNPLEFGF